MSDTPPPTPDSRSFVRIAAGCIENPRGEVLICQRPAHKIYPGEWEFPGGKLEAGESAEAALRRELAEELGIRVASAQPLIRLRHVYPELSVDLDVWKVTAYEGEVQSNEHPQVAWVAPEELPNWQLLAADRPIVNALRLPARFIITPPGVKVAEVAEAAQRNSPSLFRIRAPHWADEDYEARARDLFPELRKAGHVCIVDRRPEWVDACAADGFHASAATLQRLDRRPVPGDRWFGASCHNAVELRRATSLGADYAVVGPVQATASHPGLAPLGWEGFGSLAVAAGLPVYAIGGLGPADLDIARRHGAQGVAGISAYWGRGSVSGGVPESSGIE